MAVTLSDLITQYKADVAYSSPAETPTQQTSRVSRIYSNFLAILDGLGTLDEAVGTGPSVSDLEAEITALQASFTASLSPIQASVTSIQTDLTEKEQDIIDLENAVAALEAIPPGSSAPSPYTVSNLTCGENISADKVVIESGGQIFYFDPANTAHYGRVVGISLQAGSISTNIDVATGGLIVWAGPALTQGVRYFATSLGALTSDPSGLTVLQSAGHAVDTNKLLINFSFNLITI